MVNNKKGLSTIITTLIIILMVLVAIGIVWYAVLPMIKDASQQVDYSNKCLGVDFKAVLSGCSDFSEGVSTSSCTLTLKREPTSSQTQISGIELVFVDSTGSSEEIAYFEDDIITEKTLSTKELTGQDGDVLGDFSFKPSKISRYRAYFVDADDPSIKHYCTATTTP